MNLRHTLDTPLGKYHHYIIEGHWRFMDKVKMAIYMKEITKYCTEPYQVNNIEKVLEQMKGNK